MRAKHEDHCGLCNSRIAVGDEIERDNNERRFRSYVHASCKPMAGKHNRAAFRVEVVQGDEKGYIAAGPSGQYVRRAVAESRAQLLRDVGAREVVVGRTVAQRTTRRRNSSVAQRARPIRIVRNH